MLSMLYNIHYNYKRKDDGQHESQRDLLFTYFNLVLFDAERDCLINALRKTDKAKIDDYIEECK